MILQKFPTLRKPTPTLAIPHALTAPTPPAPADQLAALGNADPLTALIAGRPLNELTPAEIANLGELTALVIFSATARPLARLKIIDGVGRVLLAEFAALTSPDPILPVPMIAGLSADFWAAWGDYANELPTLGGNRPEWWAARVKPKLNAVLAHAARPSHRKLFTPPEYNYFRLKLALPLAWPIKGGVR